MDQERDPRPLLLACTLASAAAVVASRAAGLRGLDVAVWALLVPILVGAALGLLRLARADRHRPHAAVVVPDDVVAHLATPDPRVQVRAEAAAGARDALLAARERGAPLADLLVLARAVHEAELDLARATLAAGGLVPQAVRDELALRDRQSAPERTTYG